MTTQTPQAPKVNASLDGRLYKESANGMQYCQQHDVFFGAQGCWNCNSPEAKSKQRASNTLAAANLAHQKTLGETPKQPEGPAVVPASADAPGAGEEENV